jgi:hypothetical protein
MTTTICANCGGPRPKHPSARPDEPLYCSITCYRAGTGLDNPDTGDGRTWDPHERRYTTDRSTTNEAPPTTVTPANRWGNSTSNPGESRRAASTVGAADGPSDYPPPIEPRVHWRRAR